MPSTGSIWRSIRTTSGRRPSLSSVSSSSSAWLPPAASPTTSRSGSVSRKAWSPRRTTAWSSTMRTWIAPSSGAIRDAHSHPRALPGCALDRQATPDLGRAAAHGLESEVPRMSLFRVEPQPVVSDLEDDLPRRGVDHDRRRAGAGVLDDIGKGLAGDSEELGLGPRRQGEWISGSLDVDRQGVAPSEP